VIWPRYQNVLVGKFGEAKVLSFTHRKATQIQPRPGWVVLTSLT